MKKILFFASALAGLLLAGSCQREELAPAAEGNVVTFEVSVPEIATKANVVVDDGTNINDLVYAVYRTSATSLENAQKDENLQLIYQKNYETNPFKGNQAVVPIELINDQNYLIVFWAQVSDAWVNGNSNNLMRITYPTEMLANNSNLAAFTNATFLSAADIKGGAIKRGVTLKRPFAQIRIGTTLPKNVIEDVVLTRSSVTVNGVAEAFNALKQDIVENQHTTVEFKMAEVPYGNLTVNNVDYKYAAMNYIFANGNVGVAYNIETAQHGTVTTEAIPDVPVQRNYRTNIVGNLLTSEAKYTVTLDQDWGPEGPVDDDYVVNVASSAQDIQDAIESIPDGGSGEIKLGGDIDLGELFAASTQAVTRAGNAQLPIVVSEEKSITLDLNGFTITTPWESETDGKHYYAFDNKGTLKIVDSKATGKIVARGIFNYGHMTLESGSIEACDGNGGYSVRNYEGAEFVMNGGAIVTSNEDDNKVNNGGYDATTLRVDKGATATINGGTIKNICDYTFAIENYGTTTVNGGTFESVHSTVSTYGTMAINGGSFICDGIEGITAHCLVAWDGSQTTINGGTFNGKDNYNGFNVDASKGATVYIKGGEFLPVHSGSLYGDGSIIVTGGTFFDKVSEKYLAVGYSCQQNEEKKWIIRECPVRIGEAAYYATLAEAVAAVQEGETITILAGKTLEEGTIKLPATLKNVTFAGEEGATLKDMTITAADGNSIDYDGVTFDGITFDNSNVVLTGWRTGKVSYKNITINGCTFKNVIRTNNEAAFHINCTPTEAVNGFNFTDNVIDGVSGASNSGVYAQLTGEIFVSGNVINNVAFRPYVIQVTTDDNVADNFVVTNNTFSGSAVGRAQGLGNNANGTDAVNVVVTKNIFKGITDAQQICYWNFNPAKTTADLSHNYYDIDILANPGKIYYNSAAANVYDLLDMGVFPIYTDAAKTTLYTPEVNSAKIGETEYSTLEEAVAAAKAGDTITVLCNVTLSSELALPAGIIFNGNGKQINGTIYAGAEGNLTFAGHTKVTSFSASYYNRTITIGEGACLEVTGGGRVSLAYGNTFNITGSIENAKTADKTKIQPSLIIPAGISITGGNGAAMNVTNASVQIGSTTSKPGVANGEFTLNFENSIVEFTKELGFYEPTGGVKPTFNMNIKDCVFTTGTKLFLTNGSEVTVDNSTVALGTYIRNSGNLTLKNGSTLTGKTIQFGENGGNDGTITVDNSTLTVEADSKGHAFDGRYKQFEGSTLIYTAEIATGKIILKNTANATVTYYKDMTITNDGTCTFTGTEVQ